MSASKNSSSVVDDYFAEAPAYARPICEKLRALIRKVAPELAEVIGNGGDAMLHRPQSCLRD